MALHGPGARAGITAPLSQSGSTIAAVTRRYGKATAFTGYLPGGMNGTLSFAKTGEMSDALAACLREVCGIEPAGSGRAAGAQRAGLPVAALAVFKAGCGLANVHRLYTAEEMRRSFEDAERPP